jgi:hypothetical protein
MVLFGKSFSMIGSINGIASGAGAYTAAFSKRI